MGTECLQIFGGWKQGGDKGSSVAGVGVGKSG